MSEMGAKQLRCPSCNSVDFAEEGRFYVCQYCGGMIERDVSSIKAIVSSEESVRKLLERADLYWGLGKVEKARQLYRQVLDIDATNEIAGQRV